MMFATVRAGRCEGISCGKGHSCRTIMTGLSSKWRSTCSYICLFPRCNLFFHDSMILSRFQHSVPTHLLTVMHSSCGSFFIRISDNKLLYDSGAMPRDFRILTWPSTWSYSWRNLLNSRSEVIPSNSSRRSICLLTTCYLFPNRLLRMETASA